MELLNIFFGEIQIGRIVIGEHDERIVYIGFPGDMMIGKLTSFARKNNFFMKISETKIGKEMFAEIKEYFEGKRREFSVPIELYGTDFQMKIWGKTAEIPYGEVSTYGEIAKLTGGEKYARAVGNAMAKNPVPIVIPCHRVVGTNGKLTGFGGGIPLKRFLLELEKSNITQ